MGSPRRRGQAVTAGNLILILGDQLTSEIAPLRAGDRANDTVLMAEVAKEDCRPGARAVFGALRPGGERRAGGG